MDQTTFTEILAAHRDRLYSTALYCLRNREDAEDVVQEAFLRLWRSADDVNPDKVPSWLTRVVHNLCIDKSRRDQTQLRRLGRPDTEAAHTLPTSSGAVADQENGLILAERQQEILAALDTLSAESRSVMLLHYFQGQTLKEIGDTLGKSVSALKVRLHRARRSLYQVLADARDLPRAENQESG